MRPFFKHWITTSIAVFFAAQLPGIHFNGLFSLLLAALLLGVINAIVRPVILLLSLPLIFLTLGFFVLVVNALMLRFVAVLVPGFYVDSFGSAFFGAIVISLVSWIVRLMATEEKIQEFHTSEKSAFEYDQKIKPVKGRVIDKNSMG